MLSKRMMPVMNQARPKYYGIMRQQIESNLNIQYAIKCLNNNNARMGVRAVQCTTDLPEQQPENRHLKLDLAMN